MCCRVMMPSHGDEKQIKCTRARWPWEAQQEKVGSHEHSHRVPPARLGVEKVRAHDLFSVRANDDRKDRGTYFCDVARVNTPSHVVLSSSILEALFDSAGRSNECGGDVTACHSRVMCS